jgi:hypothetical protein
MNRTTLALALVLALAPLAGCLDPTTVDPQSVVTDAQKVLPHLELSDAHDHKDRASHDVAWNMESIGYDPVAPDVTKLGRYNHVVVHGTTAFVTAYSLEAGGAPGLATFDVSGDDPVLLATLATPDVTPIDVHVSADGKYAILAGHRDNRFTLPGDLQTCTGTPMIDVCTPYVPGGVILVDVSDPSSPSIVDTYASAPSGAHTAKILEIEGTQYVFVASYGFAYASRLASTVEILEVSSTPLGTKMVPVTRFFPNEASGNDGERRLFVHDMWIEEHPDGRMLMYVSYWDGGVVIADVSDPANPTELAAWKDFDAVTFGNIHFAKPLGVIGEKHITYAAPEYGSAEHAGEAYILDTTVPEEPKLLAKWVLPGNPINDGGYRFSPHNFDIQGTMLVYAHYHGGIWVLDVADPSNPVVKGYAFPVVPEGEPAFEATEDAPNIWAAQWTERGTILASDIGTGLHHFRVVSAEPGTPPYEAFLE